jgi:methyltransferase (TIGR00027 family)
METKRASATAVLICAYRARATMREDALISDPWAEALAAEEGRKLAEKLDAVYPHLELWTAVRTAFIDDLVREYTSPPWSFPQVVLLGAGLDTRAARLGREGVRFFEVDHPGSQADKRRRLSAVPGYPSDCATYVACDFEKDSLGERLAAAGVMPSAPAFVIWEGVTPYLPQDAVRLTLHTIATCLHPRSVLVFDHLLKKQADPNNKVANEHAQGFVKGLGEPVIFGTNDPVPMLYDAGFRHVRSASFDEVCLSLTGTYDRARQFRFQRLVVTSVTPPARGA